MLAVAENRQSIDLVQARLADVAPVPRQAFFYDECAPRCTLTSSSPPLPFTLPHADTALTTTIIYGRGTWVSCPAPLLRRVIMRRPVHRSGALRVQSTALTVR